jgi:hypothetical protein
MTPNTPDIVEKLRNYSGIDRADRAEAADEIERLRQALAISEERLPSPKTPPPYIPSLSPEGEG